MTQTVGDKIKERRNALGLNQDELAHRAGIPERSYQDYEADKREIPFSRLLAIARELRCTPNDLDPNFKEKPKTEGITLFDLATRDDKILEAIQRIEAANREELTHEERELLSVFRNDNKRRRAILIAAGLDRNAAPANQSKIRSSR